MLKNWEVWAAALGVGLTLFVCGWGGRWAFNASSQPAPGSAVWFIRVGLIVMAVGFVGVMACFIRDCRLGTNKSEAQPNLEIVIGVGPIFRQEERVQSSEGFPLRQTVCRVGIRHDGRGTVDHVSVEIESMEPHSLTVPLRLHQMHDNPQTGGQFKQDFSLDKGQTQYVDVVVEEHDDDELPTRDRVLLFLRAKGVPSRLLIFHIVPDVSQDIPVERHEIVIFAHGRDATPVRQNFIIDVDDNGALQFASA